jgi:peptide/nickel transport system permease protein
MLPNALAPVLVSATIDVASAILTESGLSFLGFGVRPPFATWGNILADGRGFLLDAPWLFFVPGLAILITVLSFNLVGEGLREAFNPRLRAR